jgi:hypothetical protein
MATPKTTEVVMKDGRVGRGIKVTARNITNVANWVSGGYMKKDEWVDNFASSIVNVARGGKESNHRVEVHTRKGKRVARVGDIVVKFRYRDDESGFDCREYEVIKAEDFAKFIKI